MQINDNLLKQVQKAGASTRPNNTPIQILYAPKYTELPDIICHIATPGNAALIKCIVKI